jgi:hypothetical protein
MGHFVSSQLVGRVSLAPRILHLADPQSPRSGSCRFRRRSAPAAPLLTRQLLSPTPPEVVFGPRRRAGSPESTVARKGRQRKGVENRP